MKITDIVQAASAALVAILTFFLWRLARRQTDLLDHSVQVAAKAADSARKSADVAEKALIGVQRPVLAIQLGDLQINPPDQYIEFEEIRIAITLKNIGREPALLVDIAAQFLPQIGNIQPPMPGRDPFERIWSIVAAEPNIILSQGDETKFEVKRLLDASRGEIARELGHFGSALFLYGIIVYDDLMGFRREMGFTFGSAREEGFFRCSFDGHNYDRLIDAKTNPISLLELNEDWHPHLGWETR